MKIIITESRIYKTMEKFLLYNHEILSEPLKVRTSWHKGNNTPMKGPVMFGGDDPRYDYNYYEKKYESKDGREWFEEYSDNHPYTNCRWEVSDELESMIDMFGEELFQGFVKSYFGIDLTEKGPHKYDWKLV